MKVVLIILATLLLGTNAFWLYKTLDNGITMTYMEVSLRDHEEALSQALDIIRESDPIAPKEYILKAAHRSTLSSIEPFQKDGYIWTGRLGLRFSEKGKLLEAVPAWN